MLRFAIIGSGEYLAKGTAYLSQHGYHPSSEPELLICLAWPEILTKKQIAEYPKGCINFHAGLPLYRGRHPLQWMLIDGLTDIPVAVHVMDEGIDTGPILAQSSVKMERNETYASALSKVTDTVGPMLIKAMDRIEAGQEALPQLKKRPCLPRRTAADSEFSFNYPSKKVHDFINAMSDPMPNAFSGSHTYKRSYIGERPGEVLAHCTDGRLVISTFDGVVLVDRA